VVASRLSEVEGWRVLLLEAGGEPPRESFVPGLAPLLLKTPVDWAYQTKHQYHGLRAYKDLVSGMIEWEIIFVLLVFGYDFNYYYY